MPAILATGVGFVGRLEGTGEQCVLGHRLRREPWVDATAAEESSLRTPARHAWVDDVGLDHQVLVDELGRVGVVGVDAADPGAAR